MVKHIRRAMGITLAAGVLAMTFAGCQNSTDPADSAEDKKPVLKQLAVYQKEDYNTYPLTKELEQAIGYTVKYDMLPQDKWEDKLNMIMASGEDYDLITIMGTGRSRYVDYANQDALVELTPLIEKYGPNIKSAVSKVALDAAEVNNKLYCIPMGSTVEPNASILNLAIAMRTDLLSDIGLSLPGTLDEFTQYLRQIKIKDPGKNGEKNIPLVISNTIDVPGVVGAFGIPNEWNLVEGKIVNRVELPAFKEYLQYLNKLYQEGLIDKEFATNKTATMYEKFTSGRAMLMPLTWVDVPTVMDTLTKNFPNAAIDYMEPPVGPKGYQGFGASSGGPGFDRITFIPKNAKNKEHAMKYINAKLEPETFKMMTIGIEGVHHTVKDGQYYPILPKFFDERGQANNYLAGSDQSAYPKYWLARLRKDDRLYKAFETMNYTKLLKYHRVNVASGSTLTPVSAQNSQIIKQLVNDYSMKFIYGIEPFEKYDEFVQQWKSKGGEQYTKDMNDWYAGKNKAQ